VGTYNTRMAEPFDSTGGEVWRTSNGSTWIQVNADGFGSALNLAVTALAGFGGYLYASTLGKVGHGAEIWRCQRCDRTDWTRVVTNGFGTADNRGMSSLAVEADWLYFAVGNNVGGMEVWRSADGTAWERIGFGGFGNPHNRAPSWDYALVPFGHSLYVGTFNFADGGEVWQLTRQVALPAIRRR
jgi:hypothetical protein